MRWTRNTRDRSLPKSAIVLALIGTIGIGAWIGVERSSMYDPISEIPLVLAVTCFLGAISLSAINYCITSGRHRIDLTRTEKWWLTTIGNLGTAAILLFVGLSCVLFLNAIAYFAGDRNWFISPAQAGEVQFFFLVGIVLTPLLIGVLSALIFVRSLRHR